MLFLCQMRDFSAQNDLCASAGSYAHKGMHMTWMRKAPNCDKKPAKTGQKPAKNCKKVQIRTCPSYPRHPVRRKNPPDASARAGGFQKTAQKYPQKLTPKSYPQSPPLASRAAAGAPLGPAQEGPSPAVGPGQPVGSKSVTSNGFSGIGSPGVARARPRRNASSSACGRSRMSPRASARLTNRLAK